MTLPALHTIPDDLERRSDPYPWLDELRTAGPVQRLRLRGNLDAWIVTRYEDVHRSLTDPRLASDPRHAEEVYATNPFFQRRSGDKPTSMLTADAPHHGRLRGAVSRAFTARRVELLRPRVRTIAEEMVDELAPRGTADLVADYALPLPIRVICELLGVPVTDQHLFLAWTARLLTPPVDAAGAQAAMAAYQALNDYISDLVAHKMDEPGDDLLSELAHADEDVRLTDAEIASSGVLLLIGGHETTVNLISTSVRQLLRNPDQLAAVRAEPSLLPQAIEEFLRFDGPNILGVYRHTTEDVSFGDVTVPKGQIVVLSIGAANRDPDRFKRPDLVDIDRPENAHLAFGQGIHYCLGAPLARLEGSIAIGTLLRRLPDLALAVADDELVWRPNVLRGLAALPVRFTPQAATPVP
jgi:cytochrome P450